MDQCRRLITNSARGGGLVKAYGYEESAYIILKNRVGMDIYGVG